MGWPYPGTCIHHRDISFDWVSYPVPISELGTQPPPKSSTLPWTTPRQERKFHNQNPWRYDSLLTSYNGSISTGSNWWKTVDLCHNLVFLSLGKHWKLIDIQDNWDTYFLCYLQGEYLNSSIDQVQFPSTSTNLSAWSFREIVSVIQTVEEDTLLQTLESGVISWPKQRKNI